MNLPFRHDWPKGMGDLAGKPTNFPWAILTGLVDNGLITTREFIRAELELGLTIEHEPWDDPNETGDFHSKIHTIRSDFRWRAGMKIHMLIYNRTKKRFQFAPTLVCKSVQKIKIEWDEIDLASSKGYWTILIDGRVQDTQSITELWKNDGFEKASDFIRWFGRGEDFDGLIIHWTDFKY